MSIRDDRPIDGRATTFGEFWAIVTHPAFRLGFLDAQAGRRIDHDLIAARILSETPESARRRLGLDERLFEHCDVALAQYRYEEGRLCVLDLGLRAKAWGHPDFPPASVRRLVIKRASEQRVASKPAPMPPGSLVRAMRSPLPLFERAPL